MTTAAALRNDRAPVTVIPALLCNHVPSGAAVVDAALHCSSPGMVCPMLLALIGGLSVLALPNLPLPVADHYPGCPVAARCSLVSWRILLPVFGLTCLVFLCEYRPCVELPRLGIAWHLCPLPELGWPLNPSV